MWFRKSYKTKLLHKHGNVDMILSKREKLAMYLIEIAVGFALDG
jgi:hypothetical protein